MNKAELQKEGKGYAVATVGNLSEFEGKAFVKDIVGTTSMEVSFGSLPEGGEVPFYHHHKQNEEVYIVLGGKGEFILDGDVVPVEEGSVVRVAPEVSRCNRNTGKLPFSYICIQAKAGSLEQSVMTDAEVDK